MHGNSKKEMRSPGFAPGRREFLSRVMKGAVTIPFLHSIPLFAFEKSGTGGPGPGSSRAASIIEVYHPDATEGASVRGDVAKLMVDEGTKAMTGWETVGDAWKSIFPGIHASSRITLKINCISLNSNHLMVHREIVDAVTAGLQLMEVEGAGFPAENITIWDMHENHLTNAGYEINTSGEGVQCKACDTPGVGYDYSYPIDVSGRIQFPCTILTEECDYLINIGLIKDHSIADGTFTLKNHYGSIHAPQAIHGSKCDPFVAVLNTDPLFEEKTALLILDSLFGVYSGGPTEYPQVVYNTMHFATDRVAIDACGKDILNQTRSDMGLGEVEVPHIATAESLGIGTTEYSVERITPTGIGSPGDHDSEGGGNSCEDGDSGAPGMNGIPPVLYQNSPNPFNPRTFLRFCIPGNRGGGTSVNLSIYDGRGCLVKRLIRKHMPPGTHLVAWNGGSDAGGACPSGVYTAVLEATGSRSHIRMMLVK